MRESNAGFQEVMYQRCLAIEFSNASLSFGSIILENTIFPADACLCSPVTRLVTVPYQTSDFLLWKKHDTKQVDKARFFVTNHLPLFSSIPPY